MRLLAYLTLACAPVLAQTSLQFEVAAIKPHPVKGLAFRIPPVDKSLKATGNQFHESLVNVRALIMDAYGVEKFQVLGLPEWAFSDSDLYDLHATIAEGVQPTSDNLREMLRSLLAERLQLRLHREAREMPVYDLVPAKGGVKLEQTEGGVSIAALILLTEPLVDRPVIDRTGLAVGYKFASLDSQGLRRSQQVDFDGPSVSIFTEVEEKWGLRLEPNKGDVQVLVVDHVERPSEN